MTAVPATPTIACYYQGKIEKACKNGGRELWNARHPDYPGVCGAGNSAHNAIRDFRVQLKFHLGRKARETVGAIVSSFRSSSPSSTPCAATNTQKLASVLPTIFGDPGDARSERERAN